jgi:DNA-binding XRE family transcriptional regulator
MHSNKRNRLEAKGWKIGSAKAFLGLSPAEAAYVEIKLKLSETFREQRMQRKMTQSEAARLLNSSQSRIAKMEAGDSSVSLDLLVRSILAFGVSGKGLIQSLSTRKSSRAA